MLKTYQFKLNVKDDNYEAEKSCQVMGFNGLRGGFSGYRFFSGFRWCGVVWVFRWVFVFTCRFS